MIPHNQLAGSSTDLTERVTRMERSGLPPISYLNHGQLTNHSYCTRSIRRLDFNKASPRDWCGGAESGRRRVVAAREDVESHETVSGYSDNEIGGMGRLGERVIPPWVFLSG